MSLRYLAFDIETAKEVPGTEFNWRPHRPLGISCAATLESDAAVPRVWHGQRQGENYPPRMEREEVEALVDYLYLKAREGYRIVTWNGLGFDFDILAEESGDWDRCRACALGHVDMMFHVVCALGYPIALEKAALGMGFPGKPAGRSGKQAPVDWREGRCQEVIDYVKQDVKMTIQLVTSCAATGRLNWITRKGTKGTLLLPKGWLDVQCASALPLPDTSWMSAPLRREEFTAWMRMEAQVGPLTNPS